jgi:membrane protease YdiL (CAAX protease family)
VTRATARGGLATYLLLVAVLTAPLHVGLIRTGALDADGSGLIWLAPLMLVPTVASVVVRILLRDGFADLSRHEGSAGARRAHRWAVLMPFAVGLVAYPSAAAVGVVGLALPVPVSAWVALIVVNGVLNLVLATGEELGWRGYMVPRLVAAGVPAPLLVNGFIWGLWHVPLFLWAGIVKEGPEPWISTVLMLVLTASVGYVMGRMRMDTGTVWPAVTLHIAWNVVIQTVFDPVATGDGKGLWIGEAGIFTAVATVVAALIYRVRSDGAA